MWDVSVTDSKGNILYESFDYESYEDAELAALDYVNQNDIDDYMIDVSQPDMELEEF